jgi:hypothetical protein
MRKVELFFVVTAICLLAMPAAAETRTGTISGTVVDAGGAALPGVTAVVTGPALQGNRVAITDGDGEFHILLLPPGADYRVVLSLSGFDTIDQVGIPVNIGRVSQLDVSMSPTAFSESIEVTADSIVVDTSTSTVDTNVNYEMLDSVFNPRNFQGVMNITPGVERNANNPRVHGAADSDNIYLVDGVDLSDPRTQTWGTALNFDAVAETQVMTAGFTAEYGRMQGGIVNLVTKSGGNEFHGVVRYIIAKEDWAADPKPGTEGGILGDENRPAINVGGPIVRDKLWFWVGYEERDRNQSFPRYTDNTVTEQYTDSSTYGGDYSQAKLTWMVNPSNTITGFWNRDPIAITNVWGRYYLGPAVDPRTETSQEQGGDNYSLQWTNIISDTTFLEVKYGQYGGVINLSAQGPLGPDPTMYDLDSGYFSGTSLEEYLSDRTRQQGSAALTYFIDTASGSHELKGGIEYMQAKNTVTDVYYPSGGLDGEGAIIYHYSGDPFLRNRFYDRDGSQVSKNPYWALFVQDSWRTGNLTLNFGLRAEQIDLINDDGTTVAGFGFGDQIAPRFGFAYDINGNSLHGSVGRFYDVATDYITAALQPSTEMVGLDEWIDGEWVEYDRYPLKAANQVVDNLVPNYTDEFTLGYDHRLGQSMSVGINYVWRTMKDMIEDFDSGTNGDPEGDDGLFTWSNQPGTWMKYSAIELVLRKRMGPKGFQFMTSYTYTIDNEGYATGSSTQVLGSHGDQDFGNTSVSIVNRYGRLDTPHQFKLDGSWSHDWGGLGLTVGVGYWWWSGDVWAERVNTTVAKGNGTEYLEPAGTNEIGKEQRLDLHVEGMWTVKSRFGFGVYVDLLNAANNQMPVRVNTLGTSSSFGDANLWQTARRFQVGFKFEF